MKKVFYSLLMVAAVVWGFWFAGQSYQKAHFTGGELELYEALQGACAGGVEARFEKVLELQEGSLTLRGGRGRTGPPSSPPSGRAGWWSAPASPGPSTPPNATTSPCGAPTAPVRAGRGR